MEDYLELSPWAPLKYSIFRVLWIATIVSNIGTCMNDVGVAWLMTSLTKQPLLVALVQTATSLPIFIFALPAGAFADIIDKRRYLIVLQSWMVIVAVLLAITTFFHYTTPYLLLFFTFCLGMGSALTAPAWQSMIPELIPSNTLGGAINLNSASMNVSRAVGPAIAGVIISLSNTAVIFAINALSFLGIIIVLFRWRRQPKESTLPTERLFGAIRTGVRYVYASPALHNVMIMALAFIFFASAVWALLPLYSRVELHYGAGGYGGLLGLFGTGAVIGAMTLPRLRVQLSTDQLIRIGFAMFAITSLILASLKLYYFACLAMLLSGYAWLMVLSSLMTAAQQISPAWIKGRAISIYFMSVYGTLAISSSVWGMIASHSTISISLFIAAFGLCISVVVTRRFTVISKRFDHTPYPNLPALVCAEELRHDQGPVMVTLEYNIATKDEAQFFKVMRELRRIRLREGAFFWKLFKDTENISRYIECFMSESWVDHLRFHERISVYDRKIQERANAFHTGKRFPRVSHFVACDLTNKKKN